MKQITTIFLFILFLSISCSDKVDYKDFIEERQPVRYAGKVDSARYFPGDNRLLIQYVLAPDPNIVQTIIYWNLRNDSVKISLDRSEMTTDTVDYILDLPEGVYSFEIYNSDRFGNISVPTYLTARSYGEIYRASLLNRKCINFEAINFVGDFRLNFGNPTETMVGVNIYYKDKNGSDAQLFVENNDTEVFLSNVDLNHPISYSTCYLPEKKAIDTFAATPDTLDIGNIFVRWSNYTALNLVGFDPGWDIDAPPSFLWDDKWGVNYVGGTNVSCTAETNYQSFRSTRWSVVSDPTWLTFDLGQQVYLAQYRHHYYYPFYASCPLYWEIWAYTADGTPTAAEGWDNWVKICEGNNDHLPTQSAEDQSSRIAAYPVGWTITFERDSVPQARYYRFKNLMNWYQKNNSSYPTTYGEFSLSEIICWVYLQ